MSNRVRTFTLFGREDEEFAFRIGYFLVRAISPAIVGQVTVGVGDGMREIEGLIFAVAGGVRCAGGMARVISPGLSSVVFSEECEVCVVPERVERGISYRVMTRVWESEGTSELFLDLVTSAPLLHEICFEASERTEGERYYDKFRCFDYDGAEFAVRAEGETLLHVTRRAFEEGGAVVAENGAPAITILRGGERFLTDSRKIGPESVVTAIARLMKMQGYALKVIVPRYFCARALFWLKSSGICVEKAIYGKELDGDIFLDGEGRIFIEGVSDGIYNALLYLGARGFAPALRDDEILHERTCILSTRLDGTLSERLTASETKLNQIMAGRGEVYVERTLSPFALKIIYRGDPVLTGIAVERLEEIANGQNLVPALDTGLI